MTDTCGILLSENCFLVKFEISVSHAVFLLDNTEPLEPVRSTCITDGLFEDEIGSMTVVVVLEMHCASGVDFKTVDNEDFSLNILQLAESVKSASITDGLFEGRMGIATEVLELSELHCAVDTGLMTAGIEMTGTSRG